MGKDWIGGECNHSLRQGLPQTRTYDEREHKTGSTSVELLSATIALCSLSSPIRTIPSALELPQILPLPTKSGSRALPPIRN
jgi:hypothetical protein